MPGFWMTRRSLGKFLRRKEIWGHVTLAMTIKRKYEDEPDLPKSKLMPWSIFWEKKSSGPWILVITPGCQTVLCFTPFKTSIAGNRLATGYPWGSGGQSLSDPSCMTHLFRALYTDFTLGQRTASQSKQNPPEGGDTSKWLLCLCQTVWIHLYPYRALVWKIFSSPLTFH